MVISAKVCSRTKIFKIELLALLAVNDFNVHTKNCLLDNISQNVLFKSVVSH